MKKAVFSILLAVVLAAVVLPSGCGLGGTVTQKKDFANFSSVDVENLFTVQITRSDSYSTTVTASKDLLDYLSLSKEGETLKVYLNPRHAFTDFTLKAQTLKVAITMPVLHELRLSGAVRGTIGGFKSSNDFKLEVSGASSLAIDKIEVGNSEFEISGASKVNGNMKGKDMQIEISGASTIKLEGSANDLSLKASGASRLDLLNFNLTTANVNLSGASEATVNAKEKLDVVLGDASRLYFHGNPTIANLSISGASTIKHK